MELDEARSKYREIMNDPDRLADASECNHCGRFLLPGEVAFAVEGYNGDYVGYVCPGCHPNQKWISALWRTLFSTDVTTEISAGKGQKKNGEIHRTVH